LTPFLNVNSDQIKWNMDPHQFVPSISDDCTYVMPALPLHVCNPAIADLFVAYLNCTTRLGPFHNLHKESIASHGKTLVDLVELLTGKKVPREGNDRSPSGLLRMYTSILTFLERHGALVNSVLPECLLDRTDMDAILEHGLSRSPAVARECELWCVLQ
jgi:hypothetical protein